MFAVCAQFPEVLLASKVLRRWVLCKILVVPLGQYLCLDSTLIAVCPLQDKTRIIGGVGWGRVRWEGEWMQKNQIYFLYYANLIYI